MIDKMYTVNEASEILKLHPRTVCLKIKGGAIRAIKISQRNYRISEKELERYIRMCS